MAPYIGIDQKRPTTLMPSKSIDPIIWGSTVHHTPRPSSYAEIALQIIQNSIKTTTVLSSMYNCRMTRCQQPSWTMQLLHQTPSRPACYTKHHKLVQQVKVTTTEPLIIMLLTQMTHPYLHLHCTMALSQPCRSLVTMEKSCQTLQPLQFILTH